MLDLYSHGDDIVFVMHVVLSAGGTVASTTLFDLGAVLKTSNCTS